MRRLLVAGMAGVLVAGCGGTSGQPGNGVAAPGTRAMAWDFDGDGYGDFAAGVDYRGSRGAVQVWFGSASGITARSQLWHQDSPGIKGRTDSGDRFGSVLASADFDADGYADLAVGIPRKDAGGEHAGAVQVLYGGAGGLTARDQLWDQDSPGVPGESDSWDYFGRALTCGDFDGDGFDDLAIGAPSQEGGNGAPGAVVVLAGSDSGLTSAGVTKLRDGRGNVTAFAAGDVTGDGRDDLVLGLVSEEDVPDVENEWDDDSAVQLLTGSASGLVDSGSQLFGLDGVVPGYSAWQLNGLALADFDEDGSDDLVLYAKDRGIVLLYGHTDGFHPAPLEVAGTPGVDAVWRYPWIKDCGPPAVADLTGDGRADLLLCASEPIAFDATLGFISGSGEGLRARIDGWDVGDDVNDLPARPSAHVFSGGSHAWVVLGDSRVFQATADGEPGPISTIPEGDLP